MVPQEQQNSLLVMLVQLVEGIPISSSSPSSSTCAPSGKRGRGRSRIYSDKLFLKALVIMIVKQIHSVHGLLCVLQQPTPEMITLRALLTTEQGRYPSRRTWERRLKAMPCSLPAQLGCLGRYLVQVLQPWATCGRAVAWDSTVLRAKGRVWHKKERAMGEVPDTRIDTDAHWTKSGWHGWVYGYKLHMVSVVADMWIPLAAYLTPANLADTDPDVVRTVSTELPEEVRFVLGDRHYDTEQMRADCDTRGRVLVAPQYGGKFPPYPHYDAGVEVRRVMHKLRSKAIENLNEHIKAIFDLHNHVPTKGLANTSRFALGSILVYQLALLYRFEHHLPLNSGLKAFLKAA